MDMMSFINDEQFTGFLDPGSIVLEEEQILWAVELSQQADPETEQWQTYLSMLALLGIQEWLQKRAPALLLKSDWLPGSGRLANPLEAACLSQWVQRLTVGEFQLCLLISDCLADPWVAVPKMPKMPTDFYVLIEVLEELAEVRVHGYLPQQLAVQSSQANQTGSETLLPISAFIAEPETLLLHLRYSDAASFRTAPTDFTPTATLTPTAALTPTPAPIVNVAAWLRNRLDQVAALTWMLLPPADLNLSGAMMGLPARSPSEDLDAVVRELVREQALVISTDARAAYRDLQIETAAVRLYALTWIQSSPEPEWSLLLILGAQPAAQLPLGIRLQVADQTQLLTEASLNQELYLYAQVVGEWHEQFRVTIALPNGASLTLPPFAFDSDSV